MKGKRRSIIVTSGINLLAGGMFLFLFFTFLGLRIQWGLAEKLGCIPYLRFIANRGANRAGTVEFAAKEFGDWGYANLFTAREMADRAIELYPNETIYYYQRGRINNLLQHYAEARTDFGYALYCWRGNFDAPSQTQLTNEFLRATLFQQTWEKAPVDPVTQSWATYIEDTIKKFPDNPYWYSARARKEMLAGHYADAKADLESALRLWRPGNAMPSQAELTNALKVATGYLEASKKVAEMHLNGLSTNP